MMSLVTLAMKPQFFFLGTLIAVFSSPIFADDPPYENCSSLYSYKAGSTFQNNLNLLLNHLSSNASTSSYYQAFVGDEPDRVYGNFMCYTYFPTQNCLPCVSQATEAIKAGCPTSKDAVRWEEQCQLRYSNQNFFGLVDYSTIITQSNLLNSSDPDLFRSVVKEMLNNLSENAAFDPSQQKYSIGKHNLTNTDSVYGFVQCTQDLTGNDCERCLQNATTVIQNCCYYYKGARVLTKSCYLRYELYPLGNQGDPTSQSQSKSKRKKVLAVVVLSIAAGLLLLLLCCFTCYRSFMRRNKEVAVHGFRVPNCSALAHRNVQGSDLIKPRNFPVINFSIIKTATNNFSDLNILGRGGFGLVYKGMLPDGNDVAVKRLSCSSEQGSEEFMNEVRLIMKLQHKNLVRLLGCCIEGDEKILVYEHMHMGSLDGFLSDAEKRAQLGWSNRFDIVIGIARGLLYLHQDSRFRIIHRDLKTSNILLDSNLKPKISDFGIARIFGGNLGESNTDRIVGTYGYMAPEYAMEGIYSIKSDVFSFGVLLLEIITGKRNNGFHLPRRAPSLLAYAWELWSEEKELELVDPLIVESCSKVELSRCLHVGLLCVQEDPTERPTMASVVVMLLGSESLVLPQPHQSAFFGGRVACQTDQSILSYDILLGNSNVSSGATS